MARAIFWDVDTQYDFIAAQGKLYVPEAEAIIPVVKRMTDAAHARGICIVASAESHQPGDPEFSDAPDYRSTYPPHCLRGSAGAEKIPETSLLDPLIIGPEPRDPVRLEAEIRDHEGDILLTKHEFDVFSNANVGVVVNTLQPDDIIVYGIAMEICCNYAIEGLLRHRPQTRIFAVMDGMKAIRTRKMEHFLRAWGDEGVRIVESTDLLDEGMLEDIQATT